MSRSGVRVPTRARRQRLNGSSREVLRELRLDDLALGAFAVSQVSVVTTSFPLMVPVSMAV
jgi:hypothetical protein